jgi:hypothetical protein
VDGGVGLLHQSQVKISVCDCMQVTVVPGVAAGDTDRLAISSYGIDPCI